MLGLISMGIVGYAFTRSIRVGGAMALVNAAVGLTFYVVYERLWARIGRGRS